MTHLSSFGIKNFKVFKDQTDFEFKPITILTGTNSSGKSSLTKSILLLRDCFRDNLEESLKRLDFDSALGNFKNVLNEDSNEEFLEFILPVKWRGIPDKMDLVLRYKNYNDESRNSGILSEVIVQLSDSKEYLVSHELNSDNSGKIAKNIFFSGEPPEISYTRKTNLKLINTLLHESLRKIKTLLNFILKGNKFFAIDSDLTFDLKSEDFNIKSVLLNETQIEDFKIILKEIIALKKFARISDYSYEWWNFQDDSFENDNIYFKGFLTIVLQKNGFGIHLGDFGRTWPEFKVDNSNQTKLFWVQKDNPVYDYQFYKEAPSSEKKYIISKLKEIEYKYDLWDLDIYSDSTNSVCNIFYKPLKVSDSHLIFGTENILDSDKITSEEVKLGILTKELGFEIKEQDYSKGANYYALFEDMIKKGYQELFKPLKNIFSPRNISYVPSIRSVPERIFKSDASFNYLENLVAQISKKEVPEFRINFLNDWLKEFGVSENIYFKEIGNTGFSELQLVRNGINMNILDVGYGYSQLLPILIKISLFPTDIIIIEEPETNLHPGLQSKLAEFFISAQRKFGIQFIIETHSEYLIRKLQYLIAQKNFDSKDANIYYFYHPDNIPENESQVKRIDFEESGILSDSFGPGFFDEATNLSIELFKLSKGQRN